MVEILERHNVETHSLYPEQSLKRINKLQQEREEKRYMKTAKPSYVRPRFATKLDIFCDGCGRTLPYDEDYVEGKGRQAYCRECSFKDKDSNLS